MVCFFVFVFGSFYLSFFVPSFLFISNKYQGFSFDRVLHSEGFEKRTFPVAVLIQGNNSCYFYIYIYIFKYYSKY